MKKYIERYIYDVTRKLPVEIQEDVEKELTANIYDMLSENPTEDEIDKVLHEIGSPRKIANNYKEDKRYVISPLYYDDYIKVLKLVLIIVGVVFMFFGGVEAMIKANEATIMGTIVVVFVGMITNLLSALVGAFFWVTVVFWLIDYHQGKVQSNDWHLKDLPDLPTPKSTKIPRNLSIAGLVSHTIISLVFIVILLKYIDVIGWYEHNVLIVKMFSKQLTDQFVVFFIFSAVITFIVQLLKIYYQEWRLNLAIAYTTSSLFSVLLMLLFINNSQLITYSFYAKLAEVMGVSVSYLQNGYKNIVIWFSGVVILLTVVDLISTWLKTLKPVKK